MPKLPATEWAASISLSWSPDYSFHQQQPQQSVEVEKTKQLNFGLEAKPEPNKNAELNVQCFEYNGEIYAKEIWKQKERSGR